MTEIAGQPFTSAVYFSVEELPLDPPRGSKIQYRGQVVEFLALDGNGKEKVRHEDETEVEVDSCILATDLKTTLPFLSDSLI